MLDDYVVCKVGQTLTPERADILKRFGHKLAQFRLEIQGFWQDSVWTQIAASESTDDDQMEDYEEEEGDDEDA